jgi:hypothetical protein
MDSMKSSFQCAIGLMGMATLCSLSAGTSFAQAPPAQPYQQYRPTVPQPGPNAATPNPQNQQQPYPAPQAYRPPVGGPVPPQQPQQQRPVQPVAANTQSAPPAAQQPSNVPVSISPNDRALAGILIKNTLIAVNQGNLTGNFTVLRDLASPGFRTRNSAGDLATIFQNLKQKKIDLSPVVVLDPLIAPPQVTKDGLLLIEGYFPSNPLRIVFKLGYIKSETGGWMIDAVSVGVVPAEATSSNQQRQAAPTQAQPAAQQRRPG